MKGHRIEFTVPEGKLQAIIGCIDGEVQGLTVSPVEMDGPESQPKRRKSPTPRVIDRLRGRSVVIFAGFLRSLKVGQELKIKQVRDLLATNGYKEGTASSLMSQFSKAGYIEKPGNHRCCAPPSGRCTADARTTCPAGYRAA